MSGRWCPGKSALSAHVLVDDIERWPVVLHQARLILRREFRIDHITLQPEWLRKDVPERVIPRGWTRSARPADCTDAAGSLPRGGTVRRMYRTGGNSVPRSLRAWHRVPISRGWCTR